MRNFIIRESYSFCYTNLYKFIFTAVITMWIRPTRCRGYHNKKIAPCVITYAFKRNGWYDVFLQAKEVRKLTRHCHLTSHTFTYSKLRYNILHEVIISTVNTHYTI